MVRMTSATCSGVLHVTWFLPWHFAVDEADALVGHSRVWIMKQSQLARFSVLASPLTNVRFIRAIRGRYLCGLRSDCAGCW